MEDGIRIYGVDSTSNYISIPFSISKDTWTTVLVEYLPEQYQRKGSYIILTSENEKRGTFICNKLPMVSADVSYIGGLQNRKKPMLTGSICAIECYEKIEKAPDILKELVLKGQMKGKQVPPRPEDNVQYFGDSFTEDFRRDQVMAWFCADYWFSVAFAPGNKNAIERVTNLTMYKSYADMFNLHFESGSRAYVKWDLVKGHLIMQEASMPWRTNAKSIPEEQMYHRYFKFRKSKYVIEYPLSLMDNVCVFIVYRIDGKEKTTYEEENYLFSCGEGNSQRGICISRGQHMRIHGVNNENKNYLDFNNWRGLKCPTIPSVWNVIAIWWNGTKSSLWINGGADHSGNKMLTFEAGEGNESSTQTVIGNSTAASPGHAFDGSIKNIEIYDTNKMSEYFIFARMKYLTVHYGIIDSVYK